MRSALLLALATFSVGCAYDGQGDYSATVEYDRFDDVTHATAHWAYGSEHYLLLTWRCDGRAGPTCSWDSVFVDFAYHPESGGEYDDRKQWDYATIQWLLDGDRMDTNGPFISQSLVDRLIESSVAECRVRYMGGRKEDLTLPSGFLGEIAATVERMTSE